MSFRLDPLDAVLYGLLSLLVIAVFVLVSWLMYIAADSWFLPLQQGQGQIVGREFTPAHDTRGLMPTGKALIPVTIHHSAEWSVTVEVRGQQDSIDVTEEFYESVANGDWIRVGYVLGRFSDKLYLRNIESSG